MTRYTAALLGLVAVCCDALPMRSPLTPVRRSPATGPLTVSRRNPRYFTDDPRTGRAVYLTGTETWAVLQDQGPGDPPPAFDWEGYLDTLVTLNHNYIRLYSWEQADWTAETKGEYRFAPLPFLRTGPGLALDGKPKFDLTRFDPAYFDRLRARIQEAGRKGIYVGIMLFDGWSIEDKDFGADTPWKGHPFNRANNVNGIDGDPHFHDDGKETHTLEIPAVTRIQEAYVRHVIDAVNDLDNVLYEISNESHPHADQWQYHMIRFIQAYEATLPKQHPVGMSAEYPDGSNASLFASPADFISPDDSGGYSSAHPPAADGRKVILLDDDHLCCHEPDWVWRSFLQGMNPLFMDQWGATGNMIGASQQDARDPQWPLLRRYLGYTLTYANRIPLERMTPHGELSTSGFCLADPDDPHPQYLVFLPDERSVTVNVSAARGPLTVEWFSPGENEVLIADPVQGGSPRLLRAPFGGSVVLYLH